MGATLHRLVVAACAVSLSTLTASAATPQRVDVEGLFDVADVRLRNRVAEVAAYPELRWPISRDASSAMWISRSKLEWDSGYFPGMLWKMYRREQNADYLGWAKRWTHGLVGAGENDAIPQAAWTTMNLAPAGHDVGLVYLNSFAEGHAATRNDDYAKVVRHAADQLQTRFNASRGTIRSWDWGTWTYPVIIDGMMTVQTLNWSAANGGSATHGSIANTHALNNAQHHVRADGSTYHVVDFGTSPPRGSTFQGYSDESTWSRGQGWAIHGFTESYRASGDATLLTTARAAADYWLAHTTDDPVPLWDLELPEGGASTLYRRDSSAAAVAASGLIQLSATTERPDEQRRYFQAAEAILNRLASSDYLAADASGETRLLLHGVGNYNGGNALDADLIYADYYFLEALERYEAAFPGPGITDGDATRDGQTNFTDLVVLAQNYNQASGQTWLDGDFTGDGAVLFADLVILAKNYNRPATMQADWALAQSLVPEPLSIAVPLIAAAAIARRRRV